jgi:ATP-dependent RNA helicase RhlE
MHADKSQVERTRALEDFKSGKIRVLVATDIAQRGLDVTGISHVINYDVPQQPEDYVHRIGRTGRAAATGDAFTFMSPDEIAMVRTIERVIGQQIPRISVQGYDFGSVAEAEPAKVENALVAEPPRRQLRRPNAARGRGGKRK